MKTTLLVLLLASLPLAANAGPVLRITEVMSSSGVTPDWFEVTNYGDAPADLTGCKMDDNSFAFASAVALNGVATLAPGESAVFVESAGGAALADFNTFWSLPGVKAGYYSGSGVGLSSNGDGVIVYNASGSELAPRVLFGAATSGKSFYWAHTSAGDSVATESGKLSADGVLSGQSTYSVGVTVTNTGSPGSAGVIIPAEIATLYWTANGLASGGSGTWSAAGTNWSTNASGIAAGLWLPGKEAAFGGSGGTVQLATAQTARALTFAADGYELSGSAPLTLTDGVVAVASNATSVVSVPLTGTNGLTCFGYGTLVLSGSNNYAGTTAVALGRLELGAPQALPVGSPLTTARFTTVDFGGFGASVGGLGGVGAFTNFGGTLTLNVAGAASVRLDGRLSGSGDVILDSSGSGAQRFDSSAQSRADGALKDYTGKTVVRRGVLEVDAAGDPVYNGVPVATSEVIVEGTALVRGELVLAGDGGSYEFGVALPQLPVITLAGGTIGNDAGETVDLYNGIAVAGNGSAIASRGAGDGVTTFDGEFHLWGGLYGSGSLRKSGQGILFLHALGTLSGAWDIANGVVDVQPGASTGSGPVAVTRTAIPGGEDVGVLRGRGTVGGSVAVTGEIDLLGQSGSLAVAGDIDLLAGGVLRFHFFGESSPSARANLSGAFRAEPEARLHVEGTPAIGSYPVLVASGGVSGAASVVVTGLEGSGLSGALQVNGNVLVLNVTAAAATTDFSAWAAGVAPGSDADGNGYTALAEFALGASAPAASFTAPVHGFAASGGTNYLTLTATVRTNGTRLAIAGQAAAGLGAVWSTSDVDYLPGNATNLPAGCEQRVYRTPAAGPQKFLRLRMNLVP